MKICILGMGSLECRILKQKLSEILEELSLHVDIEMREDIDLFLQYQISKTPSLLINNFLVSNEQLQDSNLIRHYITQALNDDDKYHEAS